ncbi:Neprilysin-11 [Hypsibius exemplaris]|uniref:Neprilysin-11 n=1 Tax=Hypsibius exemplaris TaxID=2072580 RepID=A0A1W0WU34_HYPEX|nr:Neprilysin-11 [Hypsibius exemplaris]
MARLFWPLLPLLCDLIYGSLTTPDLLQRVLQPNDSVRPPTGSSSALPNNTSDSGQTQKPVAHAAADSENSLGLGISSSSTETLVEFPESLGNQSVCETEHCYELARAMAMAMNTSINPCDDFYEYACGNWTSYNPMPDDQSSWDNFQVVAQKLTKQLREVLERDDPNDLSTARRKARTFYKACLDMDRMDTLGTWPLIKLLQSTLNGWPVLMADWNVAKFDWLSTIRRTKKYGFGLFLEWVGAGDPENPKKNMVHFVEGSLGMSSRKYYFANHSEFVRTAYKGLMRDLIVLLRDDSSHISAENMTLVQKDADDVYEFESFLAEVTRTEEDRRNLSLSLNKMTLEEFHTRCLNSSISLRDLMDYMSSIMPNATLKALVTKDLLINVGNPDYFLKVHQKLAEYSRDPKKQRVVANYIGWRLTMEFSAKMTQKLRDVVEAFSQSVDGSKKEPERWKICANKANSVMNTAVGSLYVKNYFNESSKAKIAGLVKDLREAFSNIIEKADWMDETTRTRAFTKLDSMYEYIGYADYIIDDVARLDKEYDHLDFGPDHVYNCISINKFSVESNMKDLLKKNNRSLDEALSPADVNAFYDPANNIIAFVAGILQFPFYDASRPEYLNYAGIGAIIGHEITHGFDDQGSLFDADGKFFDWWSSESRARYTHKAHGLVSKYNNYTLPEGSVNGYLTLGENIADCGGVKEAFNAYQLYSSRKGVVEPLLPGFEGYTTEQLFFLGVAQGWCGSEREKTTRNLLLTASHSPKMFRVIGPLSSMPQFAESYQCPLGSRMNPELKAAVW